jgi:hypothetical protein
VCCRNLTVTFLKEKCCQSAFFGKLVGIFTQKVTVINGFPLSNRNFLFNCPRWSKREKKILLTGDGHADDIIKGLKHHKKLDGKGRLHVDVLKVQHHGSKNNITEEFCEHITASHYIFCGNGDHHNPHWDAISTLIETRAGLPNNHPKAGEPYTLWFNCNSIVASTKNRREHMKEIEKEVKAAAEQNDLLTCNFIGENKFEIHL